MPKSEVTAKHTGNEMIWGRTTSEGFEAREAKSTDCEEERWSAESSQYRQDGSTYVGDQGGHIGYTAGCGPNERPSERAPTDGRLGVDKVAGTVRLADADSKERDPRGRSGVRLEGEKVPDLVDREPDGSERDE